jgi:hypothetical protein
VIKNFAKLDEHNNVLNIECATQEWVDAQPNKDFYVEYFDDNPASVGGDYFEGIFYPPQPYASWVRVDGEGIWIAPIPEPERVDAPWVWDEDLQQWKELEI